jgi:zinc protease
MRAVRTSILALFALTTFAAACGEETPPPNVPGPTTAHPEPTPVAVTPSAPAPKGPVTLRAPDSPVVAFRIAFDAGSADDPAGKEGLTQLVATLMSEGGTQSLTYAQLSERLYPLAASIGVQVDRDETVFVATVTRASLDRFYPLLRDVILAPRFDEASFARLKARQTSDLTSELRGANDEAFGKEALQWMLYEGHPYGHPTEGTEHGLASITLDDVKGHYARALCKDRVTVGVAGGYPDGFDGVVAQDMAKLAPCAGERAKLPPPPERHGFQLLVVDKPAAGAAAISMGFPTSVTRSDEAEYPGLLFATDYLGLHREFSGLLMQKIREQRGLNYGDFAYAEFYEQEGWQRFQATNTARREQFVSMWLRPTKRANAPFALRAALRTYTKMVEDGVPDADIARMREYLARLEGLQAQTDSRRLGYAMDDRSYGLDAPYLDVLRKGWGQLDAAKLKALMGKLLDTKNVAIAIVTADGQKLADELVSGAPPATPAYDSPKPAEIQAEDREIVKFPVPIDPKNVRVIPFDQMFK